MSVPSFSHHRVRGLPIDLSEAGFLQLLSEHHVQPLLVDGHPLISLARDAECQNSSRTGTITVQNTADGSQLPPEIYSHDLRIDSVMEGFTPLNDPHDKEDYVK